MVSMGTGEPEDNMFSRLVTVINEMRKPVRRLWNSPVQPIARPISDW